MRDGCGLMNRRSDTRAGHSTLLAEAERVAGRIDAALAGPQESGIDVELLRLASKRLKDSVILCLSALAGSFELPDDDTSGLTIEAELERLALLATGRRSAPGASSSLVEATAALQDLACRLPPERAEALIGQLAALQSALPAGIQVSTGGPYLVTNAERLTTWLGEPLPVRPQ